MTALKKVAKKALKMAAMKVETTGYYLAGTKALKRALTRAHLMGNYWAPLKALKMVAMMAETRDFR